MHTSYIPQTSNLLIIMYVCARVCAKREITQRGKNSNYKIERNA